MFPPASSNLAELLGELRHKCAAVTDRNILELLGVLAGFKAVVRLPLADEDWPALHHSCTRLGLSVARSSFKLATVRTTPLGDRFTTNVPWDDPRGDGFVAYVAQSEAAASGAASLDSVGSTTELGQLYQYPQCCTLGYGEIEAGAYWAEVLVRRSSGSRQSLYANKLAYLFDDASLFPDYFPCSLSCAQTRELGKAYYALLRRHGLRELADSLRERLGRPILFTAGAAYQFEQATIKDGSLQFDQAKLRDYSWSASPNEGVTDSGALTLREEGPWIRCFSGSTKVGTLFLFTENGEDDGVRGAIHSARGGCP